MKPEIKEESVYIATGGKKCRTCGYYQTYGSKYTIKYEGEVYVIFACSDMCLIKEIKTYFTDKKLISKITKIITDRRNKILGIK